MQHLDFILWMVLYPIASAVSGYYGAKQRKIENKPNYSSNTVLLSALVNMAIYFGVAQALF